LCTVTKNRALFFSENWNFKIEAVSKEINKSKLFILLHLTVCNDQDSPDNISFFFKTVKETE